MTATAPHHDAPVDHAVATPGPSLTATFRWAEQRHIDQYAWMSTDDEFTNAEVDEPQDYIEERWERTAVIVHTTYPPLGWCDYEDRDTCDRDAVVWQREDDVWMQACERHTHAQMESR